VSRSQSPTEENLVNALCVLVTTAWLAGVADDPPKAADQKPADQKPAQTAPAPGQQAPAPGQQAPANVVATPANGLGCGCGNGCGSGCGYSDCGCGEKEGFLSRLKGRFHKSNDCGCDSCGGYASGGHFGHTRYSDCGCASTPSCGCECDSGPSFRDRLRGIFHHRSSDCGCESGCGSSGCGCSGYAGYGAGNMTIAPGNAPKIEPIPGPKVSEPGKKLPSDGTDKQVRIAPAAPPVLEVAPAKTESPF
jgi:hypothetical protein